MTAVQNDNEAVAPEDCLIMISFNDCSAGENADALARFLTKNNFPTFCTRIYCPANAGDWRDATLKGVKTCKIYIPLLTKGWQESDECQYETRLIRTRFAAREVTIMPVYFQDFDKAYDENTDGHDYKFQWNDLQSIFREKGDEDKWMNAIISLLPKVGNLDASDQNNADDASDFQRVDSEDEVVWGNNSDTGSNGDNSNDSYSDDDSFRGGRVHGEVYEEAQAIGHNRKKKKAKKSKATDVAKAHPTGRWVRRFCIWASKWVCNSKNEYSDEIGIMAIPETIDGAILLGQSIEEIKEVGIPMVKAKLPHKRVTNPKIPLPENNVGSLNKLSKRGKTSGPEGNSVGTHASIMRGHLSPSGSVINISVRGHGH